MVIKEENIGIPNITLLERKKILGYQIYPCQKVKNIGILDITLSKRKKILEYQIYPYKKVGQNWEYIISAWKVGM